MLVQSCTFLGSDGQGKSGDPQSPHYNGLYGPNGERLGHSLDKDELDLLINNVANLNWWRTEPQDFPLVRNSVALTFGHVAFDNREFSHVYI